MEFATFWLPVIGGVLLGGIAGNAWYGGNRILAIWIGFFGVVCFLLVAVLQLTKAITTSANPNLDKPYIFIASIGFQPIIVQAGPIIIKWGIKNGGKSIATITEANMTLWFETARSAIPEIPQYTPNQHKLAGTDIAHGDTFIAEFRREIPLTENDIKAINEKRMRVYAYGYVRFRSEAGEYDCRGFIGYYNPSNVPAYGMFQRAEEDHPKYQDCK